MISCDNAGMDGDPDGAEQAPWATLSIWRAEAKQQAPATKVEAGIQKTAVNILNLKMQKCDFS